MTTPLLPENISLAIGLQTGQEAVAHALQESTNLAKNIGSLGSHFKIKIWFTEPVIVRCPYTHWTIEDGHTYKTRKCRKKVIEHIFNGFFYQAFSLYYRLRQHGRTGYPFDHLDKIKKWELILQDGHKIDTFNTYEEFKKKFDLFFITEDEIQKLWNGKSSQHGGKYLRSDFHRMGPQGQRLMQQFLRFFKGINEGGDIGYHKSPHGDYMVCSEHYISSRRPGRDITISHQTNCSIVHYSTEYHGWGNGRYGLVANRQEFLHLEDD